MESEMDAAAETSPPLTPSEASGLRRQPSGAPAAPSAVISSGALSAYERVRMCMVPEMITASQMFTASIHDAFWKNVQTEEEVRQVRYRGVSMGTSLDVGGANKCTMIEKLKFV